MPKIYALQTARKGSESIVAKNLYEVKGKPLFMHNILAARDCADIAGVYVSTDDPVIKEMSKGVGYQIIERPRHLCGSSVSHHEVILQGMFEIEARNSAFCDYLVVLLGNSMGTTGKDLTNAIGILERNKDFDSVQSVGEFNMFNPFRAHYINDQGTLDTVFTQEEIAKRKKLDNPNDKAVGGDIYFFNGSFWVCRRRAILDQNGKTPFPWLGQKICAYVQKSGVQELDAPWQKLCFDHYDEVINA